MSRDDICAIVQAFLCCLFALFHVDVCALSRVLPCYAFASIDLLFLYFIAIPSSRMRKRCRASEFLGLFFDHYLGSLQAQERKFVRRLIHDGANAGHRHLLMHSKVYCMYLSGQERSSA